MSFSDFFHLISYSLGLSMLLKMAIFHLLWLSSMPLCVYMCVYIYVYVHTHIHVYTYTYIYTHMYTHTHTHTHTGFPGGADGKESTCNAGDLGWIPGLGRSPGGGYGNPLQYSCLENPLGQSSLAAYSPWGCKESDVAK